MADWLVSHRKSLLTNPRLAASCIAVIAEAIEHAHQKDVIHRDIKPANIIVETNEPIELLEASELPNCLRITDFGLAKFIDEDGTSALTQEGGLVGTPSYMSPEQASGESEIGKSADIFAMGVLLYELATGRQPFSKNSPLATMKAIESEDPDSPRKINAAISKDLESICLKCLEKSPVDRYQSAMELSDDLRNYLEYRPVNARPLTLVKKIERWSLRNRALSNTLVVATSIIMIGLVIATILLSRANQNTNLALGKAKRQFERAEENRIKASDVVEEFMEITGDEIFDHPELQPMRKRLTLAAQNHYEDLNSQGASSIADHLRLARAQKNLAKFLRAEGKFDAANKQLIQLVDHLEQLKNDFQNIDLNVELVLSRFRLAESYIDLAQSAAAKKLLRQLIPSALHVQSELSTGSFEHTRIGWVAANSHLLLGKLNADSGNPTIAISHFEKSIEFAQSSKTKPNNDDLIFTCASAQIESAIVAFENHNIGQVAHSVEDIQKQIDQIELSRPGTLSLKHLNAQFLQLKSKIASLDSFSDAAIASVSDYISAREEILHLNPNHFSSRVLLAYAFDQKAMLHHDRGEFNDADRTILKALALARQFDSAEESASFLGLMGHLHNNAGLFAYRRKDYPLALDYLSKAIQFSERAVEKNSSNFKFQENLATHHFLQGQIHRELKEYEQAIEPLSKALKFYRNDQSGSADLNQLKQAASIGIALGHCQLRSDHQEKAAAVLSDSFDLLQSIDNARNKKSSDIQESKTQCLYFWLVSSIELGDASQTRLVCNQLKKHLEQHPELTQRFVAGTRRLLSRAPDTIRKIVEEAIQIE